MNLARADVDSAHGEQGHSAQRGGSLFQPDPLVNDHYLQSFRRGVSFAPEKELMLAVLEDAIHTLADTRTATDGRKQRLFKETEDWFFRDDADWIFSFVALCGALGLDPDYLRKGVSRWRQLNHTASLN
jgi:hypothetical protein